MSVCITYIGAYLYLQQDHLAVNVCMMFADVMLHLNIVVLSVQFCHCQYEMRKFKKIRLQYSGGLLDLIQTTIVLHKVTLAFTHI